MKVKLNVTPISNTSIPEMSWVRVYATAEYYTKYIGNPISLLHLTVTLNGQIKGWPEIYRYVILHTVINA